MKQNPMYKDRLDTDFRVMHSVNTEWVMRDFHFHDVFEIYFTMSDGVKYFVNDKVFNLEKGDLVIFNNHDLHRSVAPEESVYERFILVFNPEYVQGLSTVDTDLLECFYHREADFCHKVHLNQKQASSFLPLLEKAEYYSNSNIYGADVYRKLCLAEILLAVNTYYQTPRRITPLGSEGDYDRIKPVINYIHQHLNKPLSLDYLSTSFFLSKYHLGYLFKKSTGFTIHEYIISRRIMKARELLKKNLPVSQVCEMVGFGNNAHFIRTFKKFVGLSPKQYALKG